MNEHVTIEKAIASLQSHSDPGGIETVPLAEAHDRILAGDVAARMDLPPFNRSAYDGFALHSSDTESASEKEPAALKVVETITAGDFSGHPLEHGCAVKIMTGAALPEGADCVINFERVSECSDTVFIKDPLSPWLNVDQKGDEIRRGRSLITDGEKLSPSHLGVLAAQGISEVSVYQRPKAAVISTGSELLTPGMAHTEGKIYNSNLYVLRSLLETEGYQVGACIHVNDEEDLITEAILQLSKEADLIITTGGASVGEKDYALRALKKSGAELLFAQVRMKPGSCCYGAVLNHAVIVSLSGNPGAALTSYYRIVLPAIRKMAGRRDFKLHEEILPLAAACRKTCADPRILKGHTEISDGTLQFAAHEGQLNGMQTSFLGMDALAQVPPTDKPVEAGTMVRVFFP